MTYSDMNLFENEQLESSFFDQIITQESMGNINKTIEEILKGDPYNKKWIWCIATAEHLCTLIDYC